ncbi:hypothetical protein BDW22DRAFT_1356927 [Trametopsis cervina]|nr:hypothetical protein BDW22DRAFT_1356927 [Trametopsis cervina]
MSDAAVNPPVRIQPVQAVTIDSQTAHARVEAFLEQFQQRSTPLNGGDATVPAQLSKLRDSLMEENAAKKNGL